MNWEMVRMSEIEELRKKGKGKKWRKEVAEIYEREVTKLERINPQSPDYNVQITYLQTLLALPWDVYTNDVINIPNAEKILNKDHYGLEKVKERIRGTPCRIKAERRPEVTHHLPLWSSGSR